MLNETDLSYLLSKISFRHWEFHKGVMGNGFYIQPCFFAKDAKTKESKGQHGRKWYISRYATDSEVVQTAFKAIVTALEHEAREEFRYRGIAVLGPHFDLDEMVDAVYADKVTESKRTAKAA